MEIRFDAKQDFQIEAIEAVCDLFEGQPRVDVDLEFSLGGQAAVANRLDLTDSALLENVRSVQEASNLEESEELELIEEAVDLAGVETAVAFRNFSVEMETGTGKTYVYIRTALELCQRYGMRKFIIVVPSVAIREGVLKTFQITEKHLGSLYANVPYRYYQYDANSLSQIRQFALSDSVEFMVMTIDAFNKASNVINQPSDRLQGETPIHLVQTARPILILDEPQNLESELRVRALAALNPLMALRYSATHRNPYNLVHRLSPYEAYRQNLVKRIEVASVLSEDEFGQPFIRIEDISAKKKTITAKLSVHKQMRTGSVKEKVITVRLGDDLEAKTDRPEYKGLTIDEINPGGGFVRLSSNVELMQGEAQGADKDELFDAQIRYTIEEHFRKQARLRESGRKVLSLFFIDRVENYVADDGFIREAFVKHFNELKSQHPGWEEVDVETVHSGYFAQKRRRGGAVEILDSTSGKSTEDQEAYDLIMRDKERLLSFEEPVSFIFSHSALREGWDNPNVFQICTLNQTVSEVKKRQEVGRGMRLPVDQTGQRSDDTKTNVLTVVANESYKDYVAQLQDEIVEEYGEDGAPPKPPNARKRGVAKLRKEFTLKPEFKELWDRIKHRTRYAVEIDTDKLVAAVLEEVDKISVASPRITITKAQLEISSDDTLEALQLSAAKTASSLSGRFPRPNLIDLLEHLMAHTTPAMHLTRATYLRIFKETSSQAAMLENPHEFATAAALIIKQRLADQLVEGIKYTKLNEWYEMTQFDTEIESWEEHLEPTERSIYDHVIADSGTERKFVQDLEALDYVRLYVKLPDWFKIDTPIGKYNPDWAIVIEDRDEHGDESGEPCLYLVRETKSTTDMGKLRPDERRKILCGIGHFGELKVDYAVVSDASQIGA